MKFPILIRSGSVRWKTKLRKGISVADNKLNVLSRFLILFVSINEAYRSPDLEIHPMNLRLAKLAPVLFLLAIIVVHSEYLCAQDWPALRSSNGYGAIQTKAGILSKSNPVKLKTNWKRKLGSGYSSVVVSGGKLVTMYTDGTDDLVVCLNTENGETIWQTKTNPMFKGENGSFDGPLSTPLIHNGKVFALSAIGKLYCMTLDKGEIAWSRDLPKETGVTQPLYGFVTTPIVAGETLVIQVGAPDKSVFGLNLSNGETKWTAGDDTINSQSPSMIKLGGRDIVLAAGGKKLIGIDPVDGTVVMEHVHLGGNGQAMMPVPIGDDQILLTLDDRHSQSVKLRPQDDNQIAASEQWQQTTIKNTYNMPVLTNGGVFAYSTRILTCVEPATGRAFWKTRKPGDGFLVSVDGHLIINTKKGTLHLAKASTTGYEELSNLKLFSDLVWSVPAYSNNAIYARSLGEVARVDIVAADETATLVAETKMPLGTKFRTFLKTVADSTSDEARKTTVDQWMKSQKEFPVLEGDIAHFVYRGDQADVALAGDFFGARQEKKMTQVEGTDLSYYAMQLKDDQRVNYCFLINFKPVTDKLNKRTMTSSMYAGEMEFAVRLSESPPLKMSWFGMPNWKQQDYLKSSEFAGQMAKKTIEGKEESENIEVQIYLPPNYEKNTDRRYPVAYVFDGKGAQELGQMATAVDQMYQLDEPVAPEAILVFTNGTGPQFSEQLTDKIVPLVDKEFRTIAKRESRLLIGCGFSGGSAIITAAVKNKTFGNVASQSPLAFAAAEKMINQTMSAVELPTKVHLQWGSYDMFNPHENWDIRTSSKSIFELLSKNDSLQVTGGMVNDSTDWSSWRNRYHEMLGLLTPASK